MAAAAKKGELPIYVDWDGVTAAATPTHSTSFKASSFAWDLSAQTPVGGSGSEKTPTLVLGSLKLGKQFDQYTPLLLKLLASDKTSDTASVYIVHVNSKGEQIEALRYDFSTVHLSDDAQSTEGASQETITADFASITVTYFLGTKSVNSWTYSLTPGA